MIKKMVFVLALLLVLGLFAGCAEGLGAAEEKLDTMKEQAEDYLENKGDQVEQYMESAVDNLKDKAEDAVKDKVQEIIPTDPGFEMSEALAEAIALDHVGFTREQVTGLWSAYEIDDGVPQYDVEFHKDGWEYEFEIHGETGKILSFDKDRER